MGKKQATSTHLRIDIGLSNEIDILRAGFRVRTSRTAFVENLIRYGITEFKRRESKESDSYSDAMLSK